MTNLNFKSVTVWVADSYKKSPWLVAAIGFLIFLCVAALAMFFIKNLGTPSADRNILPASSASDVALATPTLFPSPTPAPVMSEEWTVYEDLGYKTINNYNSLVLSFKNVGTGETREAQCQSKHDPRPQLGDTYKLIDTGYKDESGKNILVFYPVLVSVKQSDDSYLRIPQDINSKFQRFLPVTLP